MASLILVRHGQSMWNATNRFSGWVDVPLSHVGRQEAMAAAQKLQDYSIDVGFTSLLVRAIETIAICLTERTVEDMAKSPVFKHNADDPNWHGWDHYDGNREEEIPIFLSACLDERYYGDLQGFNKAQMAAKVGEALVHQWRRSFDVRPPGGESLKDTAERTIPYLQQRILPYAQQGDNVLVAAHGNSLRSIMMHLENLSPATVPNLELATGVPIVYTIDSEGKASGKVILN